MLCGCLLVSHGSSEASVCISVLRHDIEQRPGHSIPDVNCTLHMLSIHH